jgi:peptidoglycan LD-endopeptidase CwlK
MINPRKFSDLHPTVEVMAKEFVVRCAEKGITVLITSTYRDIESQNALYAQGRTAPGRKVTNAKGGQSHHGFRVAFDFVPMIHGKPQWDDDYLFYQCGKIAEIIGLEWGGSWKKKDLPHCQFTGGLSLADFQSGKTLA